MGGVDFAQHPHLGGVDHAVLLPPAHTNHFVANREFGTARLNNFTGGTPLHGLTQSLGLRITLGVIHATPHVRVQTQVMVAYQHLSVMQRRGFTGDKPEVADDGLSFGAVVEMDLVIDWHGVVQLKEN